MDSLMEDQPRGTSETNGPIKLRSYQQEMLERSLERNVIVVMDTGSGKTHIAISRMAEAIKTGGPDKIVWFMCPTVELCAQQSTKVREELPAYLVKSLTGLDNVDRWTTQELWTGFLKNVKIVVCTPKVLEDALTHGFVKMSSISLMLFDEAHRCTKASPMNVVMQNFYHPAKARGETQIPSILGLSASPVMSVKTGSLETIEANLDAKAITPKVHRSELEKYVHPPDIIRIEYGETRKDVIDHSALCQFLDAAVDSYDVRTDPWLKQLNDAGDDPHQTELNKQVLKPSTRCYKQLKVLRNRANAVNEQLGRSAAEWYIQTCIQKFDLADVCQAVVFADGSEQERMHLKSILSSIRTAYGDVNGIAPRPVHTTLKVQALVTLLNGTPASNTQAIIFVEQRAVVSALCSLFRNHSLIDPSWAIGSFIGSSSFAKRDSALANLAEPREQQRDLADFRGGRKNLMICTSVLEEGIDVSACNLVICFDLPKNLVSFIQRRGRARQQHSKYALFISSQDYNADPGKWQNYEAEMKKAYMNDARPSIENEQDEVEDESSYPVYRVPETGALLTLANAKAHLYHFCATSSFHRSRHVDLRPEFETQNNGGKTPWTAVVTLPSFVTPKVRTALSSRAYATESAAIKDAAFESYVTLHKERLVNDNLLPLREDPQFIFLDQPSLIRVAQRQNSWAKILKRGCEQHVQTKWHAAILEVTKGLESITRAVVFLPVAIPTVLPFYLYWNEEQAYVASVKASSEDYLMSVDSNSSKVREFTYNISKSVFGVHMGDSNEFPVLFAPVPEGNANLWDSINAALTRQHCELVRVRSHNNRLFFVEPIDDSQRPTPESEVLVRGFPKRKDFLHPLVSVEARAAAYTAKYSFPRSECSFERIPARYAVLAAFIPSIMHKLDVALVARDLQMTVLQDAQINDTSLIIEAITPPMVDELANYNRLEFLGDSILKFCATLQVSAEHLNWPERYLSLQKHVTVSNNNLCQAALKLGLDQYILTERFTGKKWRPQTIPDLMASEEAQKREVSSKLLADVAEALVGAAYVSAGLPNAVQCIRNLLPDHTWSPYQTCITNLLSELPPPSSINLNLLETLIGHTFTNKALLLESVTHASSPSNKASSYERLEFLGDAVLDLLIVPRIFGHPTRLREWDMHRIREAVVSGDFLGYCCMNYSIEEEFHDIFLDGPEGESEPSLRAVRREVHLHDFLQASPSLRREKIQSLQLFERYREVVSEALDSGPEYPWPDLKAMRPQKFLSDIVEAVLGAIFLDTAGDLSFCEAFIEKLGILKILNRILDEEVETTFPKERVGLIAGDATVEYVISNSPANGNEGSRRLGCIVRMNGKEVATASDCEWKEEAEARAAMAVVTLHHKGELSQLLDHALGESEQAGGRTEDVHPQLVPRKRKLNSDREENESSAGAEEGDEDTAMIG